MEIKKKETTGKGIKIFAEEDGKEIGRVFLYVLKNALHDEPFAFIEDLFVDEEHRRKGIATKLIQEMIEEAKRKNCYKIVGTSRMSRENVHAMYEKIGFEKRGYEFRMNI